MRGRLAYRGPDPDDVRGIRGNGREGGARPQVRREASFDAFHATRGHLRTRAFASCQFVMPSFHFLVSATAGRENRGILPSDRTTTPRPIRPLRRVGTSCSTRCTSQSWTDRLRRPPPHFHPIGSRRTRQVPATPP